MKTYILQEITENTGVRINELLHHLDSSAPEVNVDTLRELIETDCFELFVVEDTNGHISGMLTLTYCNTLSGRKYWIEDVVVDEAFRGKGAGRALVRAAVDYVKKKEELPVIYLTSNPSRISARSLYVSEGFKEYETGVFRIK